MHGGAALSLGESTLPHPRFFLLHQPWWFMGVGCSHPVFPARPVLPLGSHSSWGKARKCWDPAAAGSGGCQRAPFSAGWMGQQAWRGAAAAMEGAAGGRGSCPVARLAAQSLEPHLVLRLAARWPLLWAVLGAVGVRQPVSAPCRLSHCGTVPLTCCSVPSSTPPP